MTSKSQMGEFHPPGAAETLAEATLNYNRARCENNVVHKMSNLHQCLLAFAKANFGDSERWSDRERHHYCDCISKTISEAGIDSLLSEELIKNLINLHPQIKNMHPRSGQPADSDHKQAHEAFVDYCAKPSYKNGRRALHAIGSLLYTIRCNYQHGEKRLGLDSSRERNLTILKTAVPVMRLIADAMMQSPQEKLVAYGSLRPDESNHHIVASIEGNWFRGSISGGIEMLESYPQYIPTTADASPIDVDVLRSKELPKHWKRLDNFEGLDYERLLCVVHTYSGLLVGNVYAKRGALLQDEVAYE